MPMSTVAASTPNYVLINGDLRIGPQVVPLNAGMEWTAIYGFSDKGPYDKFCTKSQLALKPYPLVKGYLRNQMDSPGDSLKLVVIDAARPREHCLRAATMAAVLEAQENHTTHVAAAYRLAFDPEANAYRLEDANL